MVIHNMKRKAKTKQLKYPVWTVRIEEETRDWLKKENENYGSWNKFFKEIRKRYEK